MIAIGLLSDCYRIAIGLLSDCCRIAVGLLSDCCRIAVGLLSMPATWRLPYRAPCSPRTPGRRDPSFVRLVLTCRPCLCFVAARYRQTYFPIDGYYLTGDGCRRDEDGYYWITGRVDDVINTSGHRIGTAEVESAVVLHPQVLDRHAPHPPHSPGDTPDAHPHTPDPHSLYPSAWRAHISITSHQHSPYPAVRIIRIPINGMEHHSPPTHSNKSNARTRHHQQDMRTPARVERLRVFGGRLPRLRWSATHIP